MDFDLKGCKYTWMGNPRNGISTREKIDRVLANWEWRSLYPHATALALPMISSDHSPIVLHPWPKESSGGAFKFEAMWEDHVNCQEVIQQGWDGVLNSDDAWNSFLDKAKSCQRGLVKWHKKEFRRADEQILKLKQRLSVLINQSHQHQNWEDIRTIKVRIAELWKQEEKFWCQRSRVKWLKSGDRNSSFFHASTVQRRGKNRIQRLRGQNEEWVDGREDIFRHILDHFREVYFSDEPTVGQECLVCIPNLVTDSMNATLMAPFSEADIKEAVFSMGSLKAPGPDGALLSKALGGSKE